MENNIIVVGSGCSGNPLRYCIDHVHHLVDINMRDDTKKVTIHKSTAVGCTQAMVSPSIYLDLQAIATEEQCPDYVKRSIRELLC